jgi:mono/diheme cytochrome c family protein
MGDEAVIRLALVLISFLCLTPLVGAQAPSEETLAFFKQNCSSCHTIGGGRLAGPDLKNLSQRQERDWLIRFLLDPKGVIDSGDPYAQKLLQEARGIYMTAVPGLTRARAEKLLDLIDQESKLENSQFAGQSISDRPLTARDVQIGAELFSGKQAFESGGPACISCHDSVRIGGFGGGGLGPDLTSAYSRLEGRRALSAWLSAPPSLVMQPIYKTQPLSSDEVLALVAYLREAAESGEEESEPATLQFLLAGCGSAAVILVLFDFLWRHRYRAVRRPLVGRRKP